MRCGGWAGEEVGLQLDWVDGGGGSTGIEAGWLREELATYFSLVRRSIGGSAANNDTN